MTVRAGMTFGPLALVFVAIVAPLFAGAQTYHDNVVIVLDGSGSMGTEMESMDVSRMNAAKDALKRVLVQVPETTYVGLLVFSRVHRSQPWLFPLGPRDESKLVAAIEKVKEGGGTPLGEHMKIGADRLLEERAKQFGYGSYRLLVVTDGEAGDQDKVEQFTPEILGRGLLVDVIGVDMESDHTLATKVHSYRRADDPESLSKALAEVFAEVSMSGDDAAAENEFELLEGLPFEVASVMLSALAAPSNVPIGEKDLQSDSAASRTHETRGQAGNSQVESGAPVEFSPFQENDDDDDGGFALFPIIVVGFIVLMIFRSRGRKRRR